MGRQAGRREKERGTQTGRQKEQGAGRQKGDGRYKARLRRKHLRHPVTGTGINLMEVLIWHSHPHVVFRKQAERKPVELR